MEYHVNKQKRFDIFKRNADKPVLNINNLINNKFFYLTSLNNNDNFFTPSASSVNNIMFTHTFKSLKNLLSRYIVTTLVCGGTPCYCTNPAEPISCRAWSLGACGQAHWCGGGE